MLTNTVELGKVKGQHGGSQWGMWVKGHHWNMCIMLIHLQNFGSLLLFMKLKDLNTCIIFQGLS